eukprot:6177454-Pleurochrysis_carterae.AAC.4
MERLSARPLDERAQRSETIARGHRRVACAARTPRTQGEAAALPRQSGGLPAARCAPRWRMWSGSHVAWQLSAGASAPEQRGFGVLSGNGYRKERKGSPLLNTMRLRADALARPLIWVERRNIAGAPAHSCCIDMSPLRIEDSHCCSLLLSRACSVAMASAGGELAAEPVIHIGTGASVEQILESPIWAIPAVMATFEAPTQHPHMAKAIAAKLVEEFDVKDLKY